MATDIAGLLGSLGFWACGLYNPRHPLCERHSHEAQHEPHSDHSRRAAWPGPRAFWSLRARSKRASEFDARAYDECLRDSVAEVVQRQVEAGIDIVDDGEFGKSTSWSLYALQRLSGFELRPVPPGASPFARGADRERFHEFYDELEGRKERAWSNVTTYDAVCVGPIKYIGLPELERDIANFKAALQGVTVEEAFLPVAAPSSTIPDRRNEYYRNDEELLIALAEAMRTEYRTIVDAGFLLQIDDARAAVTYDRMVPPASFEDYYRWVRRHVEVLNYALEGIPEDRVRYHVCWGSWPGPHTTDVPLGKIVDLILKVRAGAYLIEAANPRHEHEWRVWQRREVAGRQDSGAGSGQSRDERGRASRAGCRAYREICGGRSGART